MTTWTTTPPESPGLMQWQPEPSPVVRYVLDVFGAGRPMEVDLVTVPELYRPRPYHRTAALADFQARNPNGRWATVEFPAEPAEVAAGGALEPETCVQGSEVEQCPVCHPTWLEDGGIKL